MLDTGTQIDDYALIKLYTHMQLDNDCGGCCGEIEVDLSSDQQDSSMGTYFIQAI